MEPRILIQKEPFDLNAEVARLAGDGMAGAVASFTGHVRKEGDLDSLTLEHYPHMTESEIARIAGETAARWPLSGITVIHRVGRLTPGEAIVFVGAASLHRRAAFEACEFLMDYLKTHAPFWKEEDRAGARKWVDAQERDEGALDRWKT